MRQTPLTNLQKEILKIYSTDIEEQDLNDLKTILAILSKEDAIRELPSLQKRFGLGRWRKLKGVATVKLFDSTTRLAEIHWYEAHGIGKKRMKIKRYLD